MYTFLLLLLACGDGEKTDDTHIEDDIQFRTNRQHYDRHNKHLEKFNGGCQLVYFFDIRNVVRVSIYSLIRCSNGALNSRSLYPFQVLLISSMNL